ncbi:MAG: hypothetical protein ACLF0G_13680 [Candidatus Brocadiia bacterium]
MSDYRPDVVNDMLDRPLLGRARAAALGLAAAALATLLAAPAVAGPPDFVDRMDGWKTASGTTLWLGVFHGPEDARQQSKDFAADPLTGRPYDRVCATSPDGNRVLDVARAVGNDLGIDAANPRLPDKVYYPELHVHSQGNDVAFNKLRKGKIKVGKLVCYAPPGGNVAGWLSKNSEALAKADEVVAFINDEPITGAIPNLKVVDADGAPGLGVVVPFGRGHRPPITIHRFHTGKHPSGRKRTAHEASEHVTVVDHYECHGGHGLDAYRRNVYERVGHATPQWYVDSSGPGGKVGAEVDAVVGFCRQHSRQHAYLDRPLDVVVRGSGPAAEALRQRLANDPHGRFRVHGDDWSGAPDIVVGARTGQAQTSAEGHKWFPNTPEAIHEAYQRVRRGEPLGDEPAEDFEFPSFPRTAKEFDEQWQRHRPKRTYAVAGKETPIAGAEGGEWDFRLDGEHPGWVIASKRDGKGERKEVAIYMWDIRESPRRAARAVRKRHDEEAPGEKANVVVYGDGRAKALIQALKEQGYDEEAIYVVNDDGTVCKADGEVVGKVHKRHRGKTYALIAQAQAFVEQRTGEKTYAVGPAGRCEIPLDTDTQEPGPSDSVEPYDANSRRTAREAMRRRRRRRTEDDDGDDEERAAWFDPFERAPVPATVPPVRPVEPPPPPPTLPPGGAEVPRVPDVATELPPPDLRLPEPPRITVPDIGGVMLHGAASPADGPRQAAGVEVASGEFSLVVKGKNARLDPRTLRKFVTALWAVYYCPQPPGISIDPIAPGAEKHLVRYIGKVVNTDLGRVMREADYQMKKWAVGTERPDVPGFLPVDGWWARGGAGVLGASRRFWLVPRQMTFKRADGMLLFDRGEIEVKTEYAVKGMARRAAPGDLEFARFFTEHYDEIASEYPVYKELFEYAKMVSLAQYLKRSGVPLHWFLMANRHLVLTEDSPGTVDALAKGSEHIRGLTIEGGVELGTGSRFVLDEQAVAALRSARARWEARRPRATALDSPAPRREMRAVPTSFDVGRASYTTVPQQALTAGEDRRGARYCTDLALRNGGEPGLELVRVYDPRRPEGGEFGLGWRLLVPYRIRPAGEEKTEFRGAVLPTRMAVDDLLAGTSEVLTFSTDRYAIVGWVPEDVGESRVIGLFLTAGLGYRLADKLGNEFRFDPAGRLTDMVFWDTHHVKLAYVDGLTDAFAESPYDFEVVGEERADFGPVRLARRVRIRDRLHGSSEVLAFDGSEEVARYVPATEGESRWRFAALMSDGSLRALDRHGNEVAFEPGGGFAGMAPGRPMVEALSHGEQKVQLAYTLDGRGRMRVATARVAGGGPAVHYHYDGQGRLLRVTRPDTVAGLEPGAAADGRN